MMKNKALTLSIASVFALVFVLGIASAVTIFNSTDGNVAGWTINPAGSWTDATDYFESSNIDTGAILERTISTSGYNTITVKYDRQLIDTTAGTFESADEFNVSWYNGSGWIVLEETLDTTPDDTAFVPKTFALPASANNNANFKLRFICTTNSASEFCRLDNIIVEGTSTTNIPEEISACTTTGNTGDDLKIKIDDIKVDGYGKDEEWLPIDEISVDIKVENDNSDDKIKNIAVGWGLYNADTDEWYIDDEESDFNLADKKDKTVTVTFKLDDDIEDLASGDYTFYVWANGELNDVAVCASDSQDIAMQIETDFVILSNVKMVDSAECGMDVQVTADVWNIGDDEQNEVMVVIQNAELGITKKVTIGDIAEFDSEKLNTILTLPANAKEKSYDFDFMVYDEDGSIYENDYDGDESKMIIPLKIEGNCAVASTAVVSATLESGGKAGQDLVIKASVTNTGDKSTTYTLNADSYNSWATLTGVAPTMTLNKGESAEALLTFKVNTDAAGEQTFNIEVLSGTNLVLKQPVSVTIESSGFSGFKLGSNWYLWAIGALNVILVIVIIIIAVRVAKS